MVGTVLGMVLEAHDLRAFDRARNLTSRMCLFFYSTSNAEGSSVFVTGKYG